MEYIGGQALIEGVMILSKERIGIALRTGKKIITTVRPRPDFARRFGKIWFVRGVAALIEMVYVGTKALMYSADYAESSGEQHEPITRWQMAITLGISLLVAVGLFIVGPFILAGLLFQKGFLFNLTEGIIRVVIFVGYLAVISQFKDIQRVFQYHGAEHMAVHCHEAGKTLVPNNVRLFPPEHPRCGTSFLVIVMIVAIIVFSVITSSSWLVRIASRILLLPVIAGVSYELLKLSARFSHQVWMKPFMLPGILVQKITTKQPDIQQIQVAIAAVNVCLATTRKK